MVSTLDRDPVSTLVQLFNSGAAAIPGNDKGYLDPNFLRYYILVQDRHKTTDEQWVFVDLGDLPETKCRLKALHFLFPEPTSFFRLFANLSDFKLFCSGSIPSQTILLWDPLAEPYLPFGQTPLPIGRAPDPRRSSFGVLFFLPRTLIARGSLSANS